MQGRKIESFSCACINTSGLPWWLSSRKSACQYKRPRFDPWVGKIPWRREWLPTPVFLPGKSHRQRSLAGYTVHGVAKESDTIWRLNDNNKYIYLIKCNYKS